MRLPKIWWRNTRTSHLRVVQPAERVQVAAESRLDGLRDRVTLITPLGTQAANAQEYYMNQIAPLAQNVAAESRCGGVRT